MRPGRFLRQKNKNIDCAVSDAQCVLLGQKFKPMSALGSSVSNHDICNKSVFLNFHVFILGLLKMFKENMCKNPVWINNNAY